MKTHISPREFELSVEKKLRDSGVKFSRQVVIGDVQADFVIKTDGGHRIVAEAKNWTVKNEADLHRAVHQASTYKRLSNADEVIIVVAGGKPSVKPSAIVTPISALTDTVSRVVARLDKRPVKSAKTRSMPHTKIFASMPFAAEFDDTYLVGIQPAALAVDAVAERVDHDGSPGDVTAQIKEMIKSAKVVIADLSNTRPNVCHEVGYAEALGRPVIQISSTSLTDLPFNLRNNQTISYLIGRTTKLREKLEKELRRLI